MKRSLPVFERVESRRQILSHLYLWLSWVAVSAIGAFVLNAEGRSHGTHQQLGLPACGSVVAFGRPCPACGLTTSWTSVLHGDFSHALNANIFGPFLYGVYTIAAWAALIAFLSRTKINDRSRPISIALSLALGTWLAWGIFRFVTIRY